MPKRKYPAGKAVAITIKSFSAEQKLAIALAVLTPSKIAELKNYVMRSYWRKLYFGCLEGLGKIIHDRCKNGEICIHWGDHTQGKEKGNWVYFTYTIKKIDDLCVVFKFLSVEVE